MEGVWNELPTDVVTAGSFLSFKSKLDRYMDGMGLEGYGEGAGHWY